MKKELLICGCAVVGGILGGKLLRKCVNKITENKSEEVKETVDNCVVKTLATAGLVMAAYTINKRIDVVNHNTELCFVAHILDSNVADAEKIEALEMVKTKFISPKVLKFIDSKICELTEVK